MTSIGSFAFEDCSSLKNITIPSSVISIDSFAFNGCSGLENVYASDLKSWCHIEFGDPWSNPLYYASTLYINEEQLEGELKIPEGVTSIGAIAFKRSAALKRVNIPASVAAISDTAFKECSSTLV